MRYLLMLVAFATLAAPAQAARPKLDVVAAENFWGSIAAQLGGSRVTVQSVVVNPATDPHDYEPTASDARTFAGSQVAIVNGIGYDNWASQLLAADPSGSRVVVDVGDLLGLKTGDNPHQWYSPISVRRVVGAITGALAKADPADAHYFAVRERTFLTRTLDRYHALLAEIRRRFAGVPVGYSESIFQPLGSYLDLDLVTPPSFAKAVAEGTDVSAHDVETVERQARDRSIEVWVLNSQNVTPEVEQVTRIAQAHHIQVVTVTETLSPATASFESWQDAELERLLAALHRATGR